MGGGNLNIVGPLDDGLAVDWLCAQARQESTQIMRNAADRVMKGSIGEADHLARFCQTLPFRANDGSNRTLS